MKEFQRSVWLGWCFTVIAGTLLHFLYAWTQENRIVGLYSAISESTWEHLKLLFSPLWHTPSGNISGLATAIPVMF